VSRNSPLCDHTCVSRFVLLARPLFTATLGTTPPTELLQEPALVASTAVACAALLRVATTAVTFAAGCDCCELRLLLPVLCTSFTTVACDATVASCDCCELRLLLMPVLCTSGTSFLIFFLIPHGASAAMSGLRHISLLALLIVSMAVIPFTDELVTRTAHSVATELSDIYLGANARPPREIIYLDDEVGWSASADDIIRSRVLIGAILRNVPSCVPSLLFIALVLCAADSILDGNLGCGCKTSALKCRDRIAIDPTPLSVCNLFVFVSCLG
jgi:hypothetical protein